MDFSGNLTWEICACGLSVCQRTVLLCHSQGYSSISLGEFCGKFHLFPPLTYLHQLGVQISGMFSESLGTFSHFLEKEES